MDDPRNYSNLRLQQCRGLLLNALPIQWFDFPLKRMEEESSLAHDMSAQKTI